MSSQFSVYIQYCDFKKESIQSKNFIHLFFELFYIPKNNLLVFLAFLYIFQKIYFTCFSSFFTFQTINLLVFRAALHSKKLIYLFLELLYNQKINLLVFRHDLHSKNKNNFLVFRPFLNSKTKTKKISLLFELFYIPKS